MHRQEAAVSSLKYCRKRFNECQSQFNAKGLKLVLTFESEEDEEGKFVLLFLRIVDLREEAEVIIRFEGVIVVGHDVRKSVTDIS